MVDTGRTQAPPPVSAESAATTADYYLANEVGDLLMVDAPRLVENGRRRWMFTVILANAIRGVLGPVGSISVDADTGEVLFGRQEREQIEDNAERLSRSPAS